MLCSHLLWRAGEESRLLHVKQLLDAQHHSFSAGLSELLLFVTQGQVEPQVQFGTTETKDRNKVKENLTTQTKNNLRFYIFC